MSYKCSYWFSNSLSTCSLDSLVPWDHTDGFDIQLEPCLSPAPTPSVAGHCLGNRGKAPKHDTQSYPPS